MALLQKVGNIGYRKVFCKEGWEWGYFSFNPGVKIMTDYKLIGGYGGYIKRIRYWRNL